LAELISSVLKKERQAQESAGEGYDNQQNVKDNDASHFLEGTGTTTGGRLKGVYTGDDDRNLRS
jgi:hypothetical protein